MLDLDGTLLDARKLHNESFAAAIYNQCPEFKFSSELNEETEGVPTLNKVAMLNAMGMNINVEKAYIDKQLHTEKNMHMLTWDKRIPYLINELSNTYNMALVSNARSHFVYSAISLMEMTKFDIVLTANFAPLPLRKPSPWMFIEAMRLLNSQPHDVIIFEDSAVGLTAAHNSGAGTVIEVENSTDTANKLEKLL